LKVLGIDTETTGLDKKKDFITELGAVLFDVNLETGEWVPEKTVCNLIKDANYPELTAEVIKVNGITQMDLDTCGIPFDLAFESIHPLLEEADMIVAHNKGFDKGILTSQVERYMLGLAVLESKQWICSAEDLASNREFKCWKLSHLALDRGVPVDPRTLHRATDDILLMGKMLSSAKANPVEMLKYANTPDIVLQAHIPAPWTDNGVGKAQAQALGYSWEKPKGSDRQFPKFWVKKIKESELEIEKSKAPFSITNLGRL
jgi:DNA polymerase-3 subunit epsilon